jgi:hypothetical protein
MPVLLSQDYKEPNDHKGNRKKPQPSELRSGTLFSQYQLRGSILVIKDATTTASGFISFGTAITTIPTSTTPTPASAEGLLINYLGITGWSAGVKQAEFRSSDGKITAGAGVVVLDVDGITLTDGDTDSALIKWRGLSAYTGTIGTYSTLNVAKLTIDVNEPGSYESGRFHINVYEQGGDTALFRLVSETAGTNHASFSSDGTFAGLVVGGTGDPDAMLDVRGSLGVTGVLSPSQLTGDVNNYEPTGLSTTFTLRLSSDASRSITGLKAQAGGRLLAIHNVGAQNIVLVDSSGSSDAANQFALSANKTLGGDESCLLQYDGTSSRWRLLAS